MIQHGKAFEAHLSCLWPVALEKTDSRHGKSLPVFRYRNILYEHEAKKRMQEKKNYKTMLSIRVTDFFVLACYAKAPASKKGARIGVSSNSTSYLLTFDSRIDLLHFVKPQASCQVTLYPCCGFVRRKRCMTRASSAKISAAEMYPENSILRKTSTYSTTPLCRPPS